MKYKYNDYSNIEFTNAKEIVKNILCTKHKIHFDVNIASNHYNKEHNCKLCLDKEIDEDEVDIVFKNLFIERASQIYPNNDYSKIKYYGSKKMLKILFVNYTVVLILEQLVILMIIKIVKIVHHININQMMK